MEITCNQFCIQCSLSPPCRPWGCLTAVPALLCRVVAFLFRSSHSYDMQSVHLEIRRSSPLTSLRRLKFFLSKSVSKKSAKVFVDRAFWLTKFSERPHVGHDGALFSKRLLVRRLYAPVTTLRHRQLRSREGYHTAAWVLFF